MNHTFSLGIADKVVNPAGQIVGLVWKRKFLLLLIAVLANVLSWIAFTGVPRTYEATALVMISPNEANSLSETGRMGSSDLLQDQLLNSQSFIIQSESVIRSAVEAIGVHRLYPVSNAKPWADISSLADLKTKVRTLLDPGPPEGGGQEEAVDHAIIAASRSLTVRPEAKTNLIRVSFLHTQPEIAKEFVSTLLEKYKARYVQLASVTNVIGFLEERKKLFNAEFEKASLTLSSFAVKEGVYSIDEQQKLYLTRREELQGALSSTLGRISEKQAQLSELTRQLYLMKLNSASPQIAALARDAQKLSNKAITEEAGKPKDSATQFTAGDPPLLLVRVYQDTVETLVRTNSELEGLRALVSVQENQLRTVNGDLAELARKRAMYDQLKGNVELARVNAESFARKFADRQIDEAALASRKFLPPRIVQEATRPLLPIFPSRLVVLTTGLMLSLFAVACAVIVMLLRSGRPSSEDEAIEWSSGHERFLTQGTVRPVSGFR